MGSTARDSQPYILLSVWNLFCSKNKLPPLPFFEYFCVVTHLASQSKKKKRQARKEDFNYHIPKKKKKPQDAGLSWCVFFVFSATPQVKRYDVMLIIFHALGVFIEKSY